MGKVSSADTEFHTKLGGKNTLLNRALYRGLHVRRKQGSRKCRALLSGWLETSERTLLLKLTEPFTDPHHSDRAAKCVRSTIKLMALFLGQTLYAS